MKLNRTLIVSVFVVASCGLAYELIMAALASYLLGDSILQFSSIIGLYLFAMGIGAHLTKYIKDEDTLRRFIEIELLVGVIGGISALALFVAFGLAAAPFRTLLYALVLVVGTVVGMEIPLVMRVLNSEEADFKELVSKVLTFDYLGALAVSLLFPLVLAPRLGMARSALLFGILNAAVALLTARIFKGRLKNYRGLQIRGWTVLMLLLLAFAYANRITFRAEQSYFGDPVVFESHSPYQRLVVTQWKNDTRLYINGNLQFSSRDEARYHEALVLPAMQMVQKAENVLILGGGDGLAAREVLKYPQVKQLTLVDLDPEMTKTFRTSATLSSLTKVRCRTRKPKSSMTTRQNGWRKPKAVSTSSSSTCPTPPTSRSANCIPYRCTAWSPAVLRRRAKSSSSPPRPISRPTPIGRWWPRWRPQGCIPRRITFTSLRSANGALCWPAVKTASPFPPRSPSPPAI